MTAAASGDLAVAGRPRYAARGSGAWYRVSADDDAQIAADHVLRGYRFVTKTPIPPQKYGAYLLHREHREKYRKVRPNFFLIGDSLIQMWPMDGLREALPNDEIVNVGVGGDKVQNVLWRLEKLAVRLARTRHVVLLVGTNNLSAKDPPDAIAAGLGKLVGMLRVRAPRARILILQLPPRGRRMLDKVGPRREVNRAIQRIAKKLRCETMRLDRLLIRDDHASYEADLLHLSSAGYRILDRAIIEWIASPDCFPIKIVGSKIEQPSPPSNQPRPAPRMPKTFRGKLRRIVNGSLRRLRLPMRWTGKPAAKKAS
jgi:platelet-activating factor acetylhydrolase IB subunit beta/gamma